MAAGPLWSAPTLLPFGMAHFDVVAALPLLIFSVISMVEATGQTIAVDGGWTARERFAERRRFR